MPTYVMAFFGPQPMKTHLEDDSPGITFLRTEVRPRIFPRREKDWLTAAITISHTPFAFLR
jgi:hypothetical protein